MFGRVSKNSDRIAFWGKDNQVRILSGACMGREKRTVSGGNRGFVYSDTKFYNTKNYTFGRFTCIGTNTTGDGHNTHIELRANFVTRNGFDLAWEHGQFM